jgi:hypothetical protein
MLMESLDEDLLSMSEHNSDTEFETSVIDFDTLLGR